MEPEKPGEGSEHAASRTMKKENPGEEGKKPNNGDKISLRNYILKGVGGFINFNSSSASKTDDKNPQPVTAVIMEEIGVDENGMIKSITTVSEQGDESKNDKTVIDSNADQRIASLTKTTTAVSEQGDVKVLKERRVLIPVNYDEYCKMQTLLKTRVSDMEVEDEEIITAIYNGYYSTHTWMRYMRQQLAGSKMFTEIHEFLEKITTRNDLKNEDIFEIYEDFVPGFLQVKPAENNIRILSVQMSNLLKQKYPALEEQRENWINRVKLTLRVADMQKSTQNQKLK